MPKLHELLAVKTSLNGQAEKTRKDLASTFEKKRHLFEEKIVTFEPNEEGVKATIEEQSALQTSVSQELRWLAGIAAPAIDVSYRIECTNRDARGTVVVDGVTLIEDAPATALLELEKRVAEFMELVKAIPTLDPAKGFEPDEQKGVGYYRARDDVKTRTRKDAKAITLAAATDKHAAQVQLVPIDVPTGVLRTQYWSGLITPATKAALLDRAERVIRGIKQARSRANDVEAAADMPVGKRLLDYLLRDHEG
jgi:hypothetical protein